MRPSSSHLLIGGIGSGKTTQLIMARDRINEIGDTHAVYVDASLYTDIFKIQPGALIAIIGLILSDFDKSNLITAHQRNYIDQHSRGYKETEEVKKVIKKDDNVLLTNQNLLHPNNVTTEYKTITTEHKGVLNNFKTSNTYFKKKKLTDYINQIYQSVSSKKGKIVIIIDGLDRLSESILFANLVKNDMEAISKIGVGIVVVGSSLVAYSNSRDEIEQLFDYYYYQPCFDVDRDAESYDFFIQILQSRAKEDFIQKLALKSLINYSGGVLRDLINLTQAVIEEAYMSDSDNVKQQHTVRVINSFGRGKLLATSDNELKVLKEVLQRDNFIPRTQEDIKLLVSQRILEYQYPEKRYVVHPAIKVLLQEANV